MNKPLKLYLVNHLSKVYHLSTLVYLPFKYIYLSYT